MATAESEPDVTDALDGYSLTPQVSAEPTADRSVWPDAQQPERVTNSETIETQLVEPTYDFRVERDTDTGAIVSVLAKTPDESIQQPLQCGEYPTSIYHRSVADRDDTHQEVVWRQVWVRDITKADGELTAELVHHPDATTRAEAVQQESASEEGWSQTVSVPTLCESLIASRLFTEPPSAWYTTARKWTPDQTAVSRFEQRYIPVGSEYQPVDSCSDLTFEKIEGEGSRQLVDAFLTGEHTPAVEHNLGDTGAGYLAAFGAYYTPEDADERKLMAVLTLDEHQNRAYFEEHNAVLISRLCCHPHCPKNTATWMISRSRDWAAEEYDQIGSTAGVRCNEGTIYKAAGFELDEQITGWADGAGWQNREGRSAVRDGSRWYKRKWTYSLGGTDQ